ACCWSTSPRRGWRRASPTRSTSASARYRRRASPSCWSTRTSRRPSRSPTISPCSRWGAWAARGHGAHSPIGLAGSSATRSSEPELSRRARRLGWCVLAYAALAWVPWATSEYHTHVLVTSLYYVILAIGWNLLAGYTGQFSLAHHTFAGIG